MLRRARASRALLNALTTAGSRSGDPFFQTLGTHLGRAFKGDSAAIAELSNVFAQRAFLESKRRQSDQALQASEAKTRALLAAMPDLMFVQDRDGRFLDYYAAGDTYAPPEMFLGKTLLEILPADATAIHLAGFSQGRRVRPAGNRRVSPGDVG